MNYIIDLGDRIIVNKVVIYKTIRSYVNSLCIKNLSTLKGRIDATKKILNIKYNVPMYVSKDLILFKVNDKNSTIWINYVSIKDFGYKDKVATFLFNDLEILKMEVNKDTLLKRMKKIEMLIEHL